MYVMAAGRGGLGLQTKDQQLDEWMHGWTDR